MKQQKFDEASADADRYAALADDHPSVPELHRRLMGKGLGPQRARRACAEIFARKVAARRAQHTKVLS